MSSSAVIPDGILPLAFNGVDENMNAAVQLTGRDKVGKLQHWHMLIVDWRFMNPSAAWSECAKYFGVTQPWLSSIINSDLFKMYLSQRMEKHSEMLSEQLIAQGAKVAMLSLEKLEKKVELQGAGMEVKNLTDAARTAATIAGFGKGEKQSAVTINFGNIDSNVLKSAQDKLREIREKNTIEGEALESAAMPEQIDAYAEMMELPEPPKEVEDFASSVLPEPPTEEQMKEAEKESKLNAIDALLSTSPEGTT